MNGPNSDDPDQTRVQQTPLVETLLRVAPAQPYSFLSPPEGPDELGRIGGFRVVRLLGTGGMGFVFEAEELALRRRVALKVLKPELKNDPENRERFLREARAVAAIESDHVITIFHVVDAEPPYLVMQFLEGESLQDRIERSPALTLREALEIGRQTAEGLAVAHEKGLVHRDIKPANLWLERRDEGAKLHESTMPDGSPTAASHGHCMQAFRLKILDFGLVRRPHAETSLTSTGFIVGTPNFMAPEQASGLEVDGRADLFSLGCVLFTVLTRELPFQGSSAMAVMMALANTTPPLVHLKNPAVPPEVSNLVARLLSKAPEGRPATARLTMAAFDALLARYSGSTRLPASLPASDHANANVPTAITPPTRETLSPSPVLAPAPVQPRASGVISRRTALLVGGGVATAAAGAALWALFRPAPKPIVIGILHSQSGTMAVSERPVLDATLMAIEELNASGGVLGQTVQAIVGDGKSDPDIFAAEAERMLTAEQAVALFGCWTSDSRKAVRDVLQHTPGVLFYPVQYEGLESSQRIVYLGPVPNQQIVPAVDYFIEKLKKRKLFFVGSDYVFSRAAYEIVKDRIEAFAGRGVMVELAPPAFIPLGSADVAQAIAKLRVAQPDAIINAINGGTNLHFFRALHEAQINPELTPTLSLSITENEVRALNSQNMAGNYLAASYFQTVDREESREFLRKFRARYETEPLATDPAAAAYTAVKLWANAVELAGTTQPAIVVETLRGMVFNGVRDQIQIDKENLHTWLPFRFAKIRPDGLADLVTTSTDPIRPIPYLPPRTREEWESFLRGLQLEWNGKWQAPEKP